MTEESKDLQKLINEQSNILAKLGTELAKNQFNYKIKEEDSPKYWEKCIVDFEEHLKKATEYYTQVHILIKLVNKEQSGLFLFEISKFRQLGLKRIEAMKEVKKYPSIIKSKDKQQSKWSKELKDKLMRLNDECLNHEKHINVSFREFYQKNLKNILE